MRSWSQAFVVIGVAMALGALMPTASAHAQADVVVNEALSVNSSGRVDGYGDTSDWVELHNPGPVAVDLGGWGVSDDSASPFDFVFPSGSSIPAGGYLLMFASGQASRVGEFHLPFKLGSEGDWVGLVRPDGSLVSEMVLPALPTDHSVGLASDASLRVFSSPTPGTANANSSAAGIVADVEAAPSRGFYTGSVQVTLTHPDPNVQIRYTTTSTPPTAAGGTVYSGPITIDSATTLRVAAFRADWITANPVTYTYLFADDVPGQSSTHASRVDTPTEQAAVVAAVMSQPAISIVTNKTISTTTDVVTALEWIDPAAERAFKSTPASVRWAATQSSIRKTHGG